MSKNCHKVREHAAATSNGKESTAGDERGFTLLETTIAMVLLVIVGLGIASLFLFAAKNNVSAGDRQLAMAVAQQRMEQLTNRTFLSADLAATSAFGTSTTITRAGRRYVVNTIITNSTLIAGQPVTKTITVRVTPWSDGSSWSRNVATVFGSVTMVSRRTTQAVGPNRAL